jgi:hypothetical protein
MGCLKFPIEAMDLEKKQKTRQIEVHFQRPSSSLGGWKEEVRASGHGGEKRPRFSWVNDVVNDGFHVHL